MVKFIDITNYEKPTEEEIGIVLEHWALVRAHIASNGQTKKPLPNVGLELLNKVAAHQQWQAAMICTHPKISYSYGEEPMCTHCERPVRFMSDVQIKDLSKDS